MEASGEPDLSAALERLWARFLPDVLERVKVLESAAAAVAAGSLGAAEREAAHDMAHKLAGVLGTFGLERGTELARELEVIYARAEGPGTAGADRLAAMSAELRSIVENRVENRAENRN